MACVESDVDLFDCQFGGNVGHDDGGAIDAFVGSLTIDECSFNGNTATLADGGALYLNDVADHSSEGRKLAPTRIRRIDL